MKMNLKSIDYANGRELRFQGENQTFVIERSCCVRTSTGAGVSYETLKELVAFGRGLLTGDALAMLNYVASNYKL